MKRPERERLVSKYLYMSTAYGLLLCVPMCFAILAVSFASTNILFFKKIGLAMWQLPLIPFYGNFVLLGSIWYFPLALIEAIILIVVFFLIQDKYLFQRKRLAEEDKQRDFKDL